MSKTIWVTWEDHRRSRELAGALNAPLVVHSSPFPRGISHIHRSLKFFYTISARKPSCVFVQNPSIVLAFVASVLKNLFKYKLIVDRHTNFRLGKKNGLNPVNYFYDFIGNYSLRKADLTIVTNSYLQKIVEDRGGRGFVLKDLLPTFANLRQQQLAGRINIAFICTYACDEPYREVFEAAKLLPVDVHIYVTGRPPKKVKIKKLPENVTLTGFLSENEYCNLLYSSQLIMDFTTLEWCLVCGGYEALVLGKPFLTSDTDALNRLFGEAAMYTTHGSVELACNIQRVIEKLDVMEKKMIKFRGSFQKKAEEKLIKLRHIL